MDRFLSTDRGSSFKKASKMSSDLVEIDKKKKKKEKSFRRFIPAIFSKDNRKDNNESVKRKSKDERCYTHYQQPGRFSRCSELSHSNNDGKIHVELNQSLSGSIIEERLNEIKHDLFSAEGNVHSPSNDVLDTSFNSLSIDVRREENQWVVDRNSGRGCPDSQNLNLNLMQQNQCALKRQYSFQETMAFRRNCTSSGRVSAPPSQRFLIRSRSVHPTDRPLPAIPRNNAFVNEHPSEYKENEATATQKAIMVTPKGARYIVHTSQTNNPDLSYTYADKNVQCSSKIQQQSSNDQNDKNFRCSPTSSLKSNDYADSSYTANSSQKSELSPTSSKSGEYYLLGSPHPSNQTSSNDSLADNRQNLVSQDIKVEINEVEHLYDKTPSTNNLNLIQGNECQDLQNVSTCHKVELNDVKTNSEISKDISLYDSYVNSHDGYKDTDKKKMTNFKNLNQQQEHDLKFDQDKVKQYHESHSSPINKQLLFDNDQSEKNLKNNNLQENNINEKSVNQSQQQFIRKKNFHSQESQPNDQVLIASPQRDNYPIYDTPPHSLSALEHHTYSTSDSPKKISSMNNSQNILTNDLDLSNSSRTTNTQQNSSPDKNNLHQQPDQVNNCSSNELTPPKSSQRDERNYNNINQSCKNDIPKQVHSNETQSPKSQGPTHHGKNEKQVKHNFQTSPNQAYQSSSESKESLYSNPRSSGRQQPLSPQKKEMIQHLQAYYWHKKNIDFQRRSLIGIESLKAQEYAYWEQMQAIGKDPVTPVRKDNKLMLMHNQVIPSDRRVDYGPISKIERPIHVRPLPNSKNEFSLRSNNKPDVHLAQSIPSNYYMRNNVVLADCSSVGPKRVSFSNQSNVTKVGNGQWPTKHGSAPEPPTRKNKMYGSPVHFDSPHALHAKQQLIPHREHEVDRSFQTSPCLSSSQSSGMSMKRYSTPTGSHDNSGNSVTQNNLQDNSYNSENTDGESSISFNGSESGSEAGLPQRSIRQCIREEEWNADGKNRYSNEVGGTGKAEGEGANDHPGRRIGGVGVGIGGGATLAQGRSSGVGAGRSRDEPRRHTLSGDHQPSALLHHQQFNTVAAASGQPIHPLHPRHLPPPHSQYGPSSRHTTMDLEMGTKSRQRKSPLPRGYPPPSHSAMLFDDDPGIMSEVETSSTGFRRGGKQRSSLPVVRTPSKTLERPLGLVFLQYRNETKRALLPNEITSIDTVKALFVRSFPKQLTMEYLDSPHVKIYIHDSNKDMFYELEDLRSHLRDIRDRSVLRLFESDGVAGMPGNLGIPGGPVLPAHWEDQSYFSEPEFDSEFQHQHIHKSKSAKNSSASSGYYISGSSTLPRGGALLRPYSPATGVLPGPPNAAVVPGPGPKALGTPGGGAAPAKPLRNYHCGKTPLGSLGGSARFSRDSSVSLYSIPDRLHGESGYMSSPERGGTGGVVPVPGSTGSSSGPCSTTSSRYPAGPYSAGSSYEDPYYSQYSGTVTPVIDEEASSDTELLEESYSLYGVKPPGRPPSGPPRSPFATGGPALLPTGQPYDATRIRVEHMERQLANLTGLVQKALTHAPCPNSSPRDYLQVPATRDPYARSAGAGDEFDKHSSSSSASLPPDDTYLRTDVKPPKLGKDKSVSFEKSVSFSDEPPDMNSPKQHSPQHTADSKPTKPAIKSSTLPRMSSQERERHKPTPPPKPVALAAGQYVYRDLALTPEMYNQLRGLQKKAKDLRQEIKNLRRMSQAQAHTVRETIRDTFITIRAMLLSSGDNAWAAGDAEKLRLSREEDLYKQEMLWLEKDLTKLESTVEELRGNVINRKTRVNMSDVENMALILSKASKTVADLKVRFPNLQEGMKGLLSSEMEKVMREEKFLKEEPDRLESALKRCKKLTGTLVTLKRLASVQEQRLPNSGSVDAEEAAPTTPTSGQHSKQAAAPVPAERTLVGSALISGGSCESAESSHCAGGHTQRPENALDALLDELQTFSRPASQLSQVSSTSTQPPVHLAELGRSASGALLTTSSLGRAPNIAEIGRKGSVDSSCLSLPQPGGTLRRLHSYPSSSDTDTSPPIGPKIAAAAAAASTQEDGNGEAPQMPPKPPLPERNAELLQLASVRRVPPPPPPRTSSRSPLASPTSPQLPPRNPCAPGGTLRRGVGRNGGPVPPLVKAFSESNHKPPGGELQPALINNSVILSTSNSSSCESVNSQEGLQSKKERQEQLEQRHQELLRKQKALQEQYARLQQLQRNASGCTASVPPAPPDLLKKTGSESNLLAKMGLGLSTTSGSLTSLSNAKPNQTIVSSLSLPRNSSAISVDGEPDTTAPSVTTNSTTTSKVYETDIL